MFSDYIRTFTWDKKIETMVKKSGLLGGQGKQPTIVSPEEYRDRFIAAMHRYFLPVPDRWTGLGKGLEFWVNIVQPCLIIPFNILFQWIMVKIFSGRKCDDKI